MAGFEVTPEDFIQIASRLRNEYKANLEGVRKFDEIVKAMNEEVERQERAGPDDSTA